MTVLVRNTKSGPTTFSDLHQPNGGQIEVRWAGAGDPMGEDIQQVPDALMENIPFLNALDRGALQVVPPEELAQAQAARATGTAARRAADAQTSATVMDTVVPEVLNEAVMLGCIGPNNRGLGTCDVQVPVPMSARDTTPPLCASHASLAGMCVPSEHPTQRNEDGTPVTVWQYMGLTAPATESVTTIPAI